MTEFMKGQRVKVEFEGTVEDASSSWRYVHVLAGGRVQAVYLGKGVTVTHVDPKEWPPRVGDIWETDKGEWVVRYGIVNTDKLVALSLDNHPSMDLEPFKALNPVLVRRRGQ